MSRRLWWGAYGPESIFEFLVPRPRPESLGGQVPIRATRIAHKPALSGELVPVKPERARGQSRDKVQPPKVCGLSRGGAVLVGEVRLRGSADGAAAHTWRREQK